MKLLYLLFFGLITIGTTAQNVAVYDTYAAAEKAIVQDDSTIYVINFWATWCAPCVKELPSFEKLHLENKSVKVILVSLDSKKDLEKNRLKKRQEKRKKKIYEKKKTKRQMTGSNDGRTESHDETEYKTKNNQHQIIQQSVTWKGSLRISKSVLFWYLRISRRATVPGLQKDMCLALVS